jgi:cell division protein FtsB
VNPAVQDLHSPHERLLSRLNKVLILLIAGAAAIPLTNRVLPGVKEKALQDRMLAEVDSKLEEARMTHTRLTREVAALTHDPEYLSVFARDAVDPGYMGSGETIFRLAPRK